MTDYVGYNIVTMTRSFILERPLVSIIIIALLGLLAYSNTFKVPFVFDDRPNIVDNPIMRDLEYFIDPSRASNFKDYAEYPALKRRYVGHLSFALNYKLGGLDVRSYHAVNLLIHVLNGILIFWLIQLAFRTPYMEGAPLESQSLLMALFAALVFISHPVQTQAVTYIVQRLTSLTTFFYLASLIAYVQSRLTASSARRYILYAVSLLSALLAMNTKQIAFTLPLAISLFEFSFFKASNRKRAIFLVPLLLTMLVIPLSYINVDRPIGELMGDMGEATTIKNIPRIDYLLTELRVLTTYIRLLVLPVNQNLDYDYPVYDSFFALPVLLSFLFLLSIFVFGLILFLRSRIKDRSSRLVAFGIFWFFLSISVESSIIPLQVIYEHRIYLPSVGVAMAFSAGTFLLYERINSKKAQTIITSLLIALPLVFGVAAYQRNKVWKTEIGLWEDVVGSTR
jgi:hypothetical protein